jgi:hypothetical protein
VWSDVKFISTVPFSSDDTAQNDRMINEYKLGSVWKYSGLENRDTQKLALTSPTIGGRSVGVVRLQTKTTELLWKYAVGPDLKYSPIYAPIFQPRASQYVAEVITS